MADLEKDKLVIYKLRVENDREVIKMVNRAMDYEYVKMTALIILMVLVLFWITCQFGLVEKVQGQGQEHFSPYESTLAHDMYKSDASGDVPSANPAGRSNEKVLFNQLLGWGMRP